MIEPALLGRLARRLRVEPSELRVEPLTGGLSDRVFLLTCGSEQWAVRLPSPAVAGRTLEPATEASVLTAAARENLVPEVVVCDAETGFLVTRFLRGATSLNAELARERTNIDRVADIIRRLHSVQAPAGLTDFRPTELARHYISAARNLPGTRDNLLNELPRWRSEFIQLAEEYEAAFKPTVLCHNDLVAANILDDGQLWLVDFEYAVRADPILDLAGLAGLNGFDPAHCHRLLKAYYGRSRVPITLAQLNHVIRLVRLMAFFWALSHGGDDPADDRKRFAAAMDAVLR